MKVKDVRLQYQQGSVGLTLSWLNGQQAISDWSATRATLVTEVFNSGLECYFDTEKEEFLTNPTPHITADGQSPVGRVTSWDITIPRTGNIKFVLGIVTAAEHRQTSGDPAGTWVVMNVAEDDAPLVMAVVRSRYCHYENQTLRNSDIT